MTEPTLTRPDGSPVRVLIVDDEPLLADLLAMAMTTEGWSARTANDGQVALRLAREFHPDVVVLDVMMPHVDGLQVVSRLRGRGNDVPVLFLTARNSEIDRVVGGTPAVGVKTGGSQVGGPDLCVLG